MPSQIARRLLLALCSMASALLPGLVSGAQAATATVAAAATLRPALEELAPLFMRNTGHVLKLAYGSSGNFYSQIRQGAPFDLFLSADMEFPERLVAEKLASPPVFPYAKGRLVLMWHRNASLKGDASLSDVPAALKEGRLRKFAIANPNLAPYGMRAREVLKHLGLFQQVQPHLVIGENIGQATQFVSTGAAQAGLVALSLALAPELQASVRHVLIPQELHQPIVQGMVLLKPENLAARAFTDYLKTDAGRQILRKYGYD
ncbi:MAG TPA: molybdate ABC transporter substrate-binding protein [Limnobacter sp.]|nr:molybdate ABC transporter substrate-binding protein [Limnobacter sp.]